MNIVIPSKVDEPRCEDEKLALRGPSTSPAGCGIRSE